MAEAAHLGPATTVDAPKAQPPATGLLKFANRPSTEDNRWQLGYGYEPELPVRTVRNRSMLRRGDYYGTNLGAGSTPARVEVMPFLLTIEDPKSTFQINLDDPEERVKRQLEAYTPMLLERELWTGEISDIDETGNNRLASPATQNITPSGGAVPPQIAVARLADALIKAGISDVMIHASKYVALRLPDGWRNDTTMEEHGFVVVSGAGYPGTGPTGQAGPNWLYATGTVNVRLGDVDDIAPERRENIDTAKNTITFRAQRVGAVDFAGPVFACQVTEQ